MDANRDPRRLYYIHTDAHGHRVVCYGNANRIPNANAADRCAERNPDCDGYAGGERCSLHAHCLARGIDRGSSGGASR